VTQEARVGRLLIAGDSLVAGVGSSVGGWAQSLGAQTPNATIIGLPGGTSTDLCVRLGSATGEVGSRSTVIFNVGLNDSRLRPSLARTEVPLDVFRGNVQRLVDLFPGAERVSFVGLHRVMESLACPYKQDRYYLNALVTVYDYALREAADAAGASYIDVPGLDGSPELLVDGLHPSDRGYACVLYRVMEWLREFAPGAPSRAKQ
jgi:lysophospholipase L1-like esterase